MNHPKRVLDLFCGAGGAAMGLHQAWPDAEIVGVDIRPQKRYPFTFVCDDAIGFPLDGFDFIWASPPCQAYTLAQRIRDYAHPRLIGRTQDDLISSGIPFAIENVVGAPLNTSVELCGKTFGLKVYRHRIFECPFPVEQPLHLPHEERIQKMGRAPKPEDFMHVVGNFSGVKQARIAMGIDWMTREEIREAVPPAYSRYIAEQYLIATSTHPHPPPHRG